MPAVSAVTPAGNVYVDAVLSGAKWSVSSLSFSFPDSASQYGGGYGSGENGNNFAALNAAQQAAARSALAQYAAVSNLSFTEATGSAAGGGDLRFAQSDAPSTAWAYLPSPADEGGDVWFNRSGGHYGAPAKGNYAFATFLHEIGHALGLDHAHEGGMPLDRDSMEYTVMSYRSFVGGSTTGGYTNEGGGFAQTLMVYDIAAVQHMYGANYAANAGDTVYGWSSATGEAFVNGVGQGAPAANRIFQTVWDGGGTDTYDFSNYGSALSIDLQPGAWSVASSAQLAKLHWNGSKVAAGNVANALLHNNDARALIENAKGGWGADSITGNSAANVLWGNDGADALYGLAGSDNLYGGAGGDRLLGGEGHDHLDGGAGGDLHDGGLGFDFAWFNQASAGVRADLAGIGPNGGDAAGDGFTFVDGLIGSRHDDVLFGDRWSNVLVGGEGNDRLDGGGLNDVLYGGGGVDFFAMWRGGGNVTIGDYEDNRDWIDLRGMGFSSVAQVLASATDLGSDILFSFANGASLRVQNIADIADLDNDLMIA